MFKRIYNLLLDSIILKLKNFITNKNFDEYTLKLIQNKILENLKKRNLNNYILSGFKVYSQNDEDGIIESIFSDIGITNKIFVEIGIGNGLENNTHYLLLKDWRGLWIDSNKKSIKQLTKILPNNNKLLIACHKVNPKNINILLENYLKEFNLVKNNEIDFLSIDIDSIDIFCLEDLEFIKPRVICIEYNSKFPSNIKISIDNKKLTNEHYEINWEYNDYFGSSLSFIVNKLEKKNYKLISTNMTGSNAFFVYNDYYNKCRTFKQSIKDLYMPSNYNLFQYNIGHMPSFNFLIDKLNNE